MVRSKKYKYVLYDKGLYREQLYDMENDRLEMCNLAIEQRYSDVLKAHRAMLKEWMENHPVGGQPNLRYLPREIEKTE